MARRLPLLLLLSHASAVFASSAAASVPPFDAADANKDGVLDRLEFEAAQRAAAAHSAGIASFIQSYIPSRLQPYLTSNDASSTPVAALNAITMTIATELGDKTFLIAAVLSMKFNRLVVFSGSMAALAVMTLLSVGIGVALPSLLSKTWTHYAAMTLFAVFGFKLLREATSSEEPEGEMAEAEVVVGQVTAAVQVDVEKGDSGGAAQVDDPAGKKRPQVGVVGSILQLGASSVALQSFAVTFLAEWGDRSQIATIAMAAAQNAVGVAIGAIVGHCICTGLAVIGGRMMASRISERTVAWMGGILFILFALHSLVVGPDVDE